MDTSPIAAEIKQIVDELKKDYNLTLRQISIGMKHNKNYVSVEMSKGTNKTFLKELKKYRMEVIERAKDPAPEILKIVKGLKSDIEAIRADVAAIKASLLNEKSGNKN
jgi:YesN/AraC family two-component response regulator